MESYDIENILPPEYDAISLTAEEHYIVRKEGKEGVVYALSTGVVWLHPLNAEAIRYLGGRYYQIESNGETHYHHFYKYNAFVLTRAERTPPDMIEEYRENDEELALFIVEDRGEYFYYREIEQDTHSPCLIGTRTDGSKWFIMQQGTRCIQKIIRGRDEREY